MLIYNKTHIIQIFRQISIVFWTNKTRNRRKLYCKTGDNIIIFENIWEFLLWKDYIRPWLFTNYMFIYFAICQMYAGISSNEEESLEKVYFPPVV